MSKLVVRVGVFNHLKDTHYNLEKLNKHSLEDLSVVSADYYADGLVLKMGNFGFAYRTKTKLTDRRGKPVPFDRLKKFVDPQDWLILFYPINDLDDEDGPLFTVRSYEPRKGSRIDLFFEETFKLIKKEYAKLIPKGKKAAKTAAAAAAVPEPELKMDDEVKAPAAAAAPPTAAKQARCPKGTRRNKKTGICEAANAVPEPSFAEAAAAPAAAQSTAAKMPRCPKGTRRNKKTGLCEASK